MFACGGLSFSTLFDAAKVGLAAIAPARMTAKSFLESIATRSRKQFTKVLLSHACAPINLRELAGKLVSSSGVPRLFMEVRLGPTRQRTGTSDLPESTPSQSTQMGRGIVRTDVREFSQPLVEPVALIRSLTQYE